jgi:hypothetical protein
VPRRTGRPRRRRQLKCLRCTAPKMPPQVEEPQAQPRQPGQRPGQRLAGRHLPRRSRLPRRRAPRGRMKNGLKPRPRTAVMWTTGMRTSSQPARKAPLPGLKPTRTKPNGRRSGRRGAALPPLRTLPPPQYIGPNTLSPMPLRSRERNQQRRSQVLRRNPPLQPRPTSPERKHQVNSILTPRLERGPNHLQFRRLR